MVLISLFALLRMSCASGEDEEDKGMEMENDFDGQMFDVPQVPLMHRSIPT